MTLPARWLKRVAPAPVSGFTTTVALRSFLLVAMVTEPDTTLRWLCRGRTSVRSTDWAAAAVSPESTGGGGRCVLNFSSGLSRNGMKVASRQARKAVGSARDHGALFAGKGERLSALPHRIEEERLAIAHNTARESGSGW